MLLSISFWLIKTNWTFVKIASVSKILNANEIPLKEKHVRRKLKKCQKHLFLFNCTNFSWIQTGIIIGTYQEKGSRTFWEIVRRSPVQEDPVSVWKFCHLLHKLLREGYRRVIADSYLNRQWIRDLDQVWGVAYQNGYAKLIQKYSMLLIHKIEFHVRNPRFPGNLQITDEDLEAIGEQDVNVLYAVFFLFVYN